MKLISEDELLQLLKDSERLRRLDSFGVYEWNLYREALDESESFGKAYDVWADVDAPDLLKDYPTYTVAEFDNYNFE